MRSVLLAAALGVVCVSAFAQGTLNFANLDTGLAAKVTDTDGVTGLAGSAWEADLYWASGTITDSTLLTALGQPATFSTAPLEAGYFLGGVRTIPVPYYSTITAQVRVWDTAHGSSWTDCLVTPGARVGESVLFQVTGMGDPLSPSPGFPVNLTGLNGHPWSVSVVGVPEPSALALGALGLATLLCRIAGKRQTRKLKEVVLSTTLFGLVSVSAFAQGTVLFNNANVGSPNAPVYESDGVTKLSGTQFMAELFAGPSANNLGAIAMTGFLTGSQAGYFLGGPQTINSVPGGGTAWIQVDVWNTASGASFSQARASGLPDSWWQSPVFMNLTGNPNVVGGGGPSPPFPLTGLGNSPVFLNSVPEPYTLALAGLGLVGMLVLRGPTWSKHTELNHHTQRTPRPQSVCELHQLRGAAGVDRSP